MTAPTRAVPTRKVRPQAGPQERALASAADILVFGGGAGGGKTWALLLEAMRHKANPHFSAVIFRRTSPEIRNPGGLWDESLKLFGPVPGARAFESTLEWVFTTPRARKPALAATGAVIKFAHLQYEQDVLGWQGSQVPLIGFDQLETFSESQFFFMLSRNRSTCGVRPYIRATCNPDADSWLAQLLSWWIDAATGYPIPERSGVLRYMVRINDVIEWGDSPAALQARYPGIEIAPKSVTFIPASVYDNQALLEVDPGYVGNLMALSYVERERLLAGNWKVRATGGNIFNRTQFRILPALPADVTRLETVRYWDRAGTAGAGNWTVGLKMARLSDKTYVIEDVQRGRWGARDRNRLMRQVAELDGKAVTIGVEQEPGSSGKETIESIIAELAGFSVLGDRVTGSKYERADPFAAQVQAGNVALLAGPWCESFITELHNFSIDTPNGTDDQVDAGSGAFRMLTRGRPLRRIRLGF